ncbi:hypothetical protein CBS11350_10093 [Aspergillus niger]|nr:hypothetical protein CBS11350_10093 [Aspergillus niger]
MLLVAFVVVEKPRVALICVSDGQSNLIVSLLVGFQTKQSGSTRYLALFRIGALAVTSSTIQFNKTSISC